MASDSQVWNRWYNQKTLAIVNIWTIFKGMERGKGSSDGYWNRQGLIIVEDVGCDPLTGKGQEEFWDAVSGAIHHR